MSPRLVHIEIDETDLPPPTPGMDQERRVAIFDLIEANSFALPDPAPPGPYRLRLGLADRRVRFDVADEAGRPAADFTLSLGPLAQIAKDYLTLCDSYADAVTHLPPARIEAINTARRDIHLEAARQLRSRLADKVEIDAATARRLFTLICAVACPE